MAVRLPKGRSQLIATLAIMMAGAAYLPLECDWPDDRCSAIVRRAKVDLLLIDNNEDTSKLTGIPYGKPLGGQAFYVLNNSLEPCPIGVTGELFIGGRGVVREYFGDPAQTAKQFIWHPKLQQRLYRTGDTGCYLADSNI